MVTIQEAEASQLVYATAEELKNVEAIKAPTWAPFVRTGVHKDRPPVQDDWWHLRTASVLRKIALKGPIGVNKLRTLYGGKQNRGMGQETFRKGSGNIIRKVLQQLEAAGFAKQDKRGNHKGRVLTPQGQSFLNKVAKGLDNGNKQTPK